jgi:peptide/nickel transport system substrate-binding protein
MLLQSSSRKGISRVIIAVVIIVIIVVAAVALEAANLSNQTTTTSTTQSSQSTAQSSSQQSTSSSSSVASSSSTAGSSSSSSSSSQSSVSTQSSQSSQSSQSTGGAGNGTLVIDDFLFQGANGGNAGPNLLYGSADWPQWGEGSVYQSLITLNLTAEQNNNQIEFLPALASNWTLSADGMTYTFNLRHGVTYSNGDPFNAYDVWTQFYMEYFIYANSSTFWEGSAIFNMTGVKFGLATQAMLNQSGLSSPSGQALAMMSNASWPVYAPDPYTIVYHMNSQFNFFLGTLPGWLGLIFDPYYVLQHGGTGPVGQNNPYFNTNSMLGTGPYMETQVQPTAFAIFEKNPNYWGKNLTAAQIANNPILDPGHYNKILINYKPDDTTRYVDLTTGASQISAVFVSNFKLIARNPDYGFMTIKYPAEIERMAMNTQIYPTNITDVRLAIVHALNYTKILDTAVFGYGLPMVGPETPNFGPYYNPGNVSQYSYNITLAKQYLVQAGFPNGAGLPVIPMAIDQAATSYEEPQAEIIQSELAAIGIQTNIVVTLTSQYYTYFGPYSYELTNAKNIPAITFDGSIPYAPDFMTPIDYWSFFVTNYTLFGNYAVYSNPIVNTNVGFMFHSDNMTAILEHLAVAEKQIALDAPYAWLYDAQLALGAGSYAYNKHVIGGFLADPNLEGVDTVPILNTIYPAS